MSKHFKNLLNKIYDKYLFLYTIIIVLIQSTATSNFSKKLGDIYIILTLLLFCIGLICVCKSVKLNYIKFTNVFSKMIYLLFLISYIIIVYIACFFIGLDNVC